MEKGNEQAQGTTGGAVTGIAVGAASGAAAAALISSGAGTTASGPRTITAEDRALLQEIYRGADRAGLKIAGISTITQLVDAIAGSKAHPVVIGKTATITVGVGRDGSLVAEGDERATSTLTIDVRPGVEFDSHGEAHVVWNGYARRVDKATGRIVGTGKAGPTRKEWEAKVAGRPSHVAGNDPAFKDWVIESMPDSPEEAARQALSSAGLLP